MSLLHSPVICIISDRHDLYDDRAYWKQALSLIKAGFSVHYIVVNSYEQQQGITKEGVYFYLIKRKQFIPSTLLNYLVKKIVPFRNEYDEVVEVCKKINPDIFQIIDLRINRIISKLRSEHTAAKFIYDIREPRDYNLLYITSKKWPIPFFIKKMYAQHIQQWEYDKTKCYDYLIGVDDEIERRVLENCSVNYTTIYNYTNLKALRKNNPLSSKMFDAAYIGGISELRGALVIAEATRTLKKEFNNIKILLLGGIHDVNLRNYLVDFIAKYDLKENLLIKEHVPYSEISDYYNQVKIGLNPLLQIKAHETIIQIKLFEYMNFGLPIIASNFGYMKKYVEENNVGVCVKPNDPIALANAIKDLLDHPEKINQMGLNGVKAVDEKYNWELMSRAYISIINGLINRV